MEIFNKGKDSLKGKNMISSRNVFAKLDFEVPLSVRHLARIPTDDWVRPIWILTVTNQPLILNRFEPRLRPVPFRPCGALILSVNIISIKVKLILFPARH